MVKIRLARFGSKKRPYYHIVVADIQARRDGRFLEQIGIYDPSRPLNEGRLDLDRADYWVGVGAKPSDRVKKLINMHRRAASEAPAVAPAPVAAPKVAEAAVAEAAVAEAAEAVEASDDSAEQAPAEA